jgi:predicted nucleic acid-binding protein
VSGYLVVDASVWVARLVAGDVFHQPSRSFLDEQRGQGIVFLAPSLLLVEVAGAISRRTREPDLARRAVTTLRSLDDLRLVAMDDDVVQEAAELARSLGVRVADAFYLAVAKRLEIPLATLDVDQRQRAATVLDLHPIE